MRLKTIAISVIAIIATLNTQAQTNYKKQLNSAEITQALNKLDKLASVLYVAAHPDDENTRLIAYLANHLHVRTGYLSMTRGDGGQNLVGAEKGALMGVLRTQELLEARKIDGGEQFFTRANDFGYSKTPEETFEFWGRDSILADVVLTIRRFKPDVMITRFPADGGGGHGHHTASAILANEAFDLAADPNYNPWSIKVAPHQVKRLMFNASTWWDKDIAEKAKNSDSIMSVEVGDYNPLLAKSYMEIASESRSMHKSQGFGSGMFRGSHMEYLIHLKGEEPGKDGIFSGINTTWSRVSNGGQIGASVERALKAYKPENPKLVVPILMQVYEMLTRIENTEHWARIKKAELTQLIMACAGVWTEATADDYRYAYGDDVKVTAQAIVRTDYPVILEKVVIGNTDTSTTEKLKYNQMFDFASTVKAPNKSTTPYWLQNEDYYGRYHVADVNLIGKPENDAPLMVHYYFNVIGMTVKVSEPVMYKWTDRVDGELYRPVVIAPAVTMNIQNDVYVFNNSQPKEVKVKLKAQTDKAVGSLLVNLPEGWTFSSPEMREGTRRFIPFVIPEKGDEKDIVLTVTPSEGSKGGEISLEVLVQGNSGEALQNLSMTSIEYPHIQTQVVMTEAKAKLINLSLKTTKKRIGYIEGAGDNVPDALREIGYDVMMINPEELSEYELMGFDVIIAGIRAYNTRDNLMANNAKLLGFVKNGGTYIVQYNTSGRWSRLEDIGPYPFTISRDRVTKEDAPAKMLKSKVLKQPNKIDDDDFNNWVQERGLYFATDWSKKYETVIEWNDPGEDAKQGALLVGEYGQGVFMYTGISFFRQLPAGVPGAYKLLVNMIEYGK